MMVPEIAKKFAKLESELAKEKGGFTFFALLMREALLDRWDLIVAADWLGQDRGAAIDYLVDEIKSKLGAEYLVQLARIIPVDPDNANLAEFIRKVEVEHGNVELRDETIFGQDIKRAHIITSKRPASAAA
jgi:hypothetical protein